MLLKGYQQHCPISMSVCIFRLWFLSLTTRFATWESYFYINVNRYVIYDIQLVKYMYNMYNWITIDFDARVVWVTSTPLYIFRSKIYNAGFRTAWTLNCLEENWQTCWIETKLQHNLYAIDQWCNLNNMLIHNNNNNNNNKHFISWR